MGNCCAIMPPLVTPPEESPMIKSPMIKGIGLALAALLMTTSISAQAAAPDKYEFDKSHTHIIFFVNHLGYSYTVGRIKEFDGFFTFDEKEPEKSTVEVTLKPASVDTSVPALDKELVGEKFFNTAKFPTMKFKSTAVKVTGQNMGTVTGDFTLLGVTKPVTLQVTYNRSGIHPFTNNYVSGFTMETRFKRSDFGMSEFLPAVGDEVIAHIEVEGINPAKKADKIKK
jgi:polyisoprenoid-binding protein YceI